MLQRFKITSCMFILFSIGLLLTGVSPVIAQDQNLDYGNCNKYKDLKKNRNCWRGYAQDLEAALTEAQAVATSPAPAQTPSHNPEPAEQGTLLDTDITFLAERGWDHSFGCLQREISRITSIQQKHAALGNCARQRAREIESVISNYNKSK